MPQHWYLAHFIIHFDYQRYSFDIFMCNLSNFHTCFKIFHNSYAHLSSFKHYKVQRLMF